MERWRRRWAGLPVTRHPPPPAALPRAGARTLEASRSGLRGFFQWAADHGLDVLAATRPEIQLYVRTMEEQGLAPSTIDRRLSTVCGLYRFAHIDGRIASNPAFSNYHQFTSTRVVPAQFASFGWASSA